MTAVFKTSFTERGAIQNVLYLTGLIIYMYVQVNEGRFCFAWTSEEMTILAIAGLLPLPHFQTNFSEFLSLLSMSHPSLHAIEEMLPAHCLLVCSLAHPFSGVLFCPEHREVSLDKPQSDYLALHAHVPSSCCPLLFFLLAVFLMQHLQCRIRLPWGPVRRKIFLQ